MVLSGKYSKVVKLFDSQHPYFSIATQPDTYIHKTHMLSKNTIYDYSQLFNVQKLVNIHTSTLQISTQSNVNTMLENSDDIDL